VNDATQPDIVIASRSRIRCWRTAGVAAWWRRRSPPRRTGRGGHGCGRLTHPQTAADRIGFELTPRERDVLALMRKGASNKAIARRLEYRLHTANFPSVRCSTS